MTLGPIEKISTMFALISCVIGCGQEATESSQTFGSFWPRDTQTAVFDRTEGAFRRPVRNLPPPQQERFFQGRGVFEQTWTPHQGLGPSWNADACTACHARDGRSAPITQGQPTQALVLRTLLPSSTMTALPSAWTGWQLGTHAP